MDTLMNLGENVLFIAALASVFFFIAFFIISRLGSDLFVIYKQNFLKSVGKGLRDVIVLMDPTLLFSLTLIVAIVAAPVLFFMFGWIVALTVVVILFLLPKQILAMMKKKRADLFLKQLPDALASMGASLRAGLNLTKAMQQIVKNQPAPISQEFAQVLVEYRVGNDLNDSLDDLANRIGHPELALMNTAIKISRSVGGNLGNTLDALANTLREKAKVEAKINAITSMGRAQAMMAMLFPFGMGILFYNLEPRALGKLFTTPLGWIWLSIMIGMMILARLLIKKVVTIDV